MRQPLLKTVKPRRQYPETRLQKAIVQHLMLLGVPEMEFFAVPNGVKMSPRTAALQKSLGMKAGVPDLVIDISGIIHYLEVKAAGKLNNLSPDQSYFLNEAWKRGAHFAVVDSIDVAIKILEAWGAIRKRTQKVVA